MRAAWTNTDEDVPAYEQNVPFRDFDIEEVEDGGGVFEGSLAAGNSDLDPLESMNLDASVEWYLQPSWRAGGSDCSTRTSTIRSIRCFEELEEVGFRRPFL